MEDLIKVRLRTTLITFALLTCFTVSSHASVIFSDNFDTDTTGYLLTGAIDPYFTVTANNVDIVGGALAGSLCTGLESGNCLDTDGSPAGMDVSGTIMSINIGLIAGDSYVLSFDINGSQRTYGLSSTTDVTLSGAGNANLVNTAITEPYTFVAATPFTYNFTALSTGNVNLVFASQDPSGQNAGNLLDNITLTNTTSAATPEPISMLLFGGGLLAVGLIGRRKKIDRL